MMDPRYPVGVRFHPKDYEIVDYFLRNKLADSENFNHNSIPNLDNFYTEDPWVLWERYGGPNLEEGGSLYFFAKRNRKNIKGSRFSRNEVGNSRGTWSNEGLEKVFAANRVNADGGPVLIGIMRKFLYECENNSTQNCAWHMHEFQIDEGHDTVVIRLKKNSRRKPGEAAPPKQRRMRKSNVDDQDRRPSTTGKKPRNGEACEEQASNSFTQPNYLVEDISHYFAGDNQYISLDVLMKPMTYQAPYYLDY